MSRYEDEIPTRPDIRNPRTDSDHNVGVLMVEVIRLTRRIETLESLAFYKEIKRQSDRPGPTLSEVGTLAKKTIQWAILVIAGIVSALKELGYLKP